MSAQFLKVPYMNNINHEGTLLFMTDPICSWCWGTLPEILKLKATFGERLDFQLRCAGLQVGSMKPLTEAHIADLQTLWRSVAETTGQQFAYTLPRDETFIYHSELACRALQIARRALDHEPWDVFHNMQRAFYVDGLNLGDLDVLFELSANIGLTRSEFDDAIRSDEITDKTRAEFAWCNKRGTQALPTLFLDMGNGPKLVCGGYATAEYLIPEISSRLKTH